MCETWPLVVGATAQYPPILDPALAPAECSISSNAASVGTITLRAYVWAKDPVTARRMHYDMNHAMLKAFPENGIPFALPIRQVVQVKPQDSIPVNDGQAQK